MYDCAVSAVEQNTLRIQLFIFYGENILFWSVYHYPKLSSQVNITVNEDYGCTLLTKIVASVMLTVPGPSWLPFNVKTICYVHKWHKQTAILDVSFLIDPNIDLSLTSVSIFWLKVN